MQPIRLGVNIDHVATLRNARGGNHPDPIRAAHLCVKAGADSITAHLREDRRHIRDEDIARLKKELTVPLNLEMAATREMQSIALVTKPHACCLVPEKREERTTEGGLDVLAQEKSLADYIAPLLQAGVRVSLFIDPIPQQLEAAVRIGAQAVELHTGTYCNMAGAARERELAALRNTATLSRNFGIECHAGHGLSYDNIAAIAVIPEIIELNIGHFLMGEAMFLGMTESIGHMRTAINEARSQAAA